MKHTYRRWALGMLAILLALLTACAAFVYAVDPCFYYRLPEKWEPVFFNERYQDAGLARNVDADTVLLGTSMVANWRASWLEKAFGGTAVKLTIPDGYLSEFDTALKAVWQQREPDQIVFSLDTNILIRDESGLTGALPGYLYDQNPLNDIKYLLNKDTLYYSVYTLLQNRRGQGETLDDAFTWDGTVWWNHITALENYQRPEIAAEPLPADAYAANTAANLAVILGWVTGHPDTEFDIFFPPYSILYWDKEQRLGETDAVFAALTQAFSALTKCENVRLYYFPADTELTLDLDNYCDYIHHSGETCRRVLEAMQTDTCRVTEENQKELLATWREFVVNYPYDQLWDESYWQAWNAAKAAPPAP